MPATGPILPIESMGSTNRSARLNLSRLNGIRYIPIDVTARAAITTSSQWTLPIDVGTCGSHRVEDPARWVLSRPRSGRDLSPRDGMRLNVIVVAAAAPAEDSFTAYQSFEVDVAAGVGPPSPS